MTAEHPIAAFLKARLGEVEKAARDAHAYDIEAEAEDYGPTTYQVTSWAKAEPPVKVFVDQMSPARVLREVEAKRRIIDEMVPVLEDLNELAYSEGQAAKRPGRPGEYMDGDHEPELHLLRLLALPYADHEDFDPAWSI